MKRTLLFAGLAAVLVLSIGWMQADKAAMEQKPAVRDGMLIHISHFEDDPHRVLMPLSLALKVSGAYDVQVFLDIDAVHLVTRDGEDLTFHGFDQSSKELVQALLDKGIQIDVCPMCMKSHGVEKDDLIDGVRVATAETFNGFTKGRIIPMDW